MKIINKNLFLILLMVAGLAILTACTSSSTDPKVGDGTTKITPSGQAIKLTSNQNGEYSPKEIRVKLGSTVRIEGDEKTLVGGMDTIIIDGYGLKKKVVPGDNVLEFTADKVGEFSLHCANGMGYGKFVVED